MTVRMKPTQTIARYEVARMCPPWWLEPRALFRPLLRGFVGRLFPGTSVLEPGFHRMISFVTGVFEYALVGPAHRHRGAPGPRPRRRIGDGEFVEQRIRVGAREALDEMHVLIGAAVLTERQCGNAFRSEVRRLDNERIFL